GYHTSGFQAHVRTSPDIQNVRIYASEWVKRGYWLQLRKSDVFEKADIIPALKENSLFTLLTSFVDEKVDEPPCPDPNSN
ncbi:hypothetical protein AVEN_150428-1, partial [Araneus ventricosus]